MKSNLVLNLCTEFVNIGYVRKSPEKGEEEGDCIKCLEWMVDKMRKDILCNPIYVSKSSAADSQFEKRDIHDNSNWLRFT